MADAKEIHTPESLNALTRITLRRLCRARGMPSDDCSVMSFDNMVDWVLADQEDGGGKKKRGAAPKESTSKRKTREERQEKPAEEQREEQPMEEPREEPPRRSRREPPGRRSSSRADDSLAGDTILRELAELRSDLADIKKLLKTLGGIVDTNIGSLIEQVGEQHADTYGISRRQRHMYQWLLNSEAILPEHAPDGLDLDSLDEEIEAACEGNEEGGSE